MNKYLVLSLSDLRFVISFFGDGKYKSKRIPAAYFKIGSSKESFRKKFDRKFSKTIINFMAEYLIFPREINKVTVCYKETKITKQLKPNLPFLKRVYVDNSENFNKAKDILNVFLQCCNRPIRKITCDMLYLEKTARRAGNV